METFPDRDVCLCALHDHCHSNVLYTFVPDVDPISSSGPETFPSRTATVWSIYS